MIYKSNCYYKEANYYNKGGNYDHGCGNHYPVPLINYEIDNYYITTIIIINQML